MAQIRKKRFKEKRLQFSLVPGISTNGIHTGWYFNKFSINLLAGISAGSRHLEIAGISNTSILSNTGIQIAGVANVVGSNSFINLTLSEERERMKDELDKPLMHGIQIAGLVNLVRRDVSGIQLTGGFNQSNGSMTGLQLAGIGNTVYQHLMGTQLAGFYNIANSSVSGMQISLLANHTKGALHGMQIGFWNKNFRMPGKRTNPPTHFRSLQVGVFNTSKNMAGTQIGLINMAGEMSGTQIGILNFFSTKPVKRATKNGVPIGILNFGSKGHFTRFSYNDLFVFNLERSSGNCSNCSDTQYGLPINDDYQKFNQNSIIVSYNPSSKQNTDGYWALGWRFERLMYIKHTMFPKKNGPQNGAHFLSWGAGIQHINRSEQVKAALSVVTSFQGTYGRRLNLFGARYLYITARFSSHFYENADFGLSPPMLLLQNKSSDFKYDMWLGYTFGIQV
ncbi:hypothetical protein FNH22_16110 [Fulvivirga sp. M361]|uniref:LA_2272 family surface repeat-containing protein n=1 Tax=Fulvivirga sp. M361 TaxID=2594266 RepID=UPI00117B7B20|nr:hypothetical protein [Fulvivirga sp. M361]TRX56165.1 hypothetical protein FNH22_16110 [Fulvivirga sp. M361]